ncbi:hypothetical protein [Candidatus Nanohalovita haloferacivicina]|uniref:hypothetical protein n=1 Tax=Candidatus Nanohalovita haloferacivicina TaxID=2978046 RepID=UPI00325FD4D2|nr:Lysyl-tRNA synthetase, class I [Candidatus Nanohalobia archaeon BNXNv]
MDNFRITSEFSEVESYELEGDKVAVGFRPSGELHVGNLLSIGYAAVIADELDFELDLWCCDTDWSAHIHEHHQPENNKVMKLFFQRDCECGKHENVAHHRVDEIRGFLDGLESETVDVEVNFLSDYREESYLEALRNVLNNIDGFDEIFGGGFRRRYRSPVTGVCSECGFSHAKGSAYSRECDELVHSCWNPDCSQGFSSTPLSGGIGVYYLVDPVRDPGRDVAVHVFGGDYRDAEKGQKTSKVLKVARITDLACGETPAYFLGPLIADEATGKPLSKSKDTGRTVSEIDDLEEYGREIAVKVREWLNEEKRFVSQADL